MSQFRHRCMHMAARAYVNETEFDYFHKTTQPFLMCFKEIIFA